MKILLGITGSIAAYKACDLISQLKKRGHVVKAIMTKNSLNFITEMTISTLTGYPVLTNMWDETKGVINHIEEVQEWADLLLIAPATANILAKCANGIADDYLSTMYLASTCKKIFVPAMNTTMWGYSAVKRNVSLLISGPSPDILMSNSHVMPPDSGRLACGTTGLGKFPKVEKIIEFIENAFFANRELD